MMMLRYSFLTAPFAIRLSEQAAVPRAVNNADLPALKFNGNGNGTFQIAIFSDMHFGQYESSTGTEQDLNTVRVMGDVLDYDPPNLVVLNGDLIDGGSTWEKNSTHYIDQIVAPIVKRNLTWASIYGNHDHSYYASGDNMLKGEQMFSGARTQKMVTTDLAGTTNYCLPVYSGSCTNDSTCTPELILWFFDSRGVFHFQGESQPSWVDISVVTWFNEANESLLKKYQKTLPSLVFVHIPINTTWALQTEAGVNEHNQPGINDDPPCAQQGAGWCTDDNVNGTCPYGGQDVPFMKALIRTPGIIGVFHGHDHGNTWCYKWDSLLPGMTAAGNGLNLCYVQHSGYGGYGDWIRGARQIVVSEANLKNFVVDSHIRLEAGDIVGAVTLNSTFNTDSYPATPDQLTYIGYETGGRATVFLAKESSTSTNYNRKAVADHQQSWIRLPPTVFYAGLWALFVLMVL